MSRQKKKASPKKYCHCSATCGKLLSRRTRRLHYKKLKGQTEIRDSESADSNKTVANFSDVQENPARDLSQGTKDSEEDLEKMNVGTDLEEEDGQGQSEIGTELEAEEVMDMQWGASEMEDGPEDSGGMGDTEATADSGGDTDDEGYSELEEIDTETESGREGQDMEDEWGSFDANPEAYKDISSDEERLEELDSMLGEEEYGELWDISEFSFVFERIKLIAEFTGQDTLSDQDHDMIRAFKLRMLSNMPRVAWDQMRHAFAHKLQICSLYVAIHRMAILSGVEPLWIDCCVNSCIAYTGRYSEREECPECDQERYKTSGKPRRVFCYLPLIPRLQNFFHNENKIKELLYRYEYEYSKSSISDVFDSKHYQDIRKKYVTIDGVVMSYKYFSGKHDIAFSVCFDGYLLYNRRRGGPTATPLLVQLYNLPPEIRTHMSHSICLGVIPGPHGPKDLATFLYHFEEECVALAEGVKTYSCLEREHFLLRAYLLFGLGDILAAQKLLNIKGVNGKCPCRSCGGKATRTGKHYYLALTRTNGTERFDPFNPPLRHHRDWKQATLRISKLASRTAKDKLAKELGIKGMPAIGRVKSLDYARGVPWDYMHLLLENVVKTLIGLWMGTFKGLDSGTEDYIIPTAIWDEIGEETAAAIRDIPADFCRAIHNFAKDMTNVTAEGWSFWFMYIAPIVLRGRFMEETYYDHFMDLVDIMKKCIQFSITHEDLTRLENDIVGWVRTYEQLV